MAEHLPKSLKHSRHGGTEYTIPNLTSNGSLWLDVKEGDQVGLYSEGDGHCFHTMFISQVDNTSSPKVIKYCAHTVWREDYDLANTDAEPDWKTSGRVKIICLDDAPIVRDFVIYSGSDPIKWRWYNTWCVENFAKHAGKRDLTFRVTFDTKMKTTAIPQIKLILNGTEYAFEPWTSGINGDFIQNCTWKGRIIAANLPNDMNTSGVISIRAQAIDGSYNDATNDLSKLLVTPSQYV